MATVPNPETLLEPVVGENIVSNEETKVEETKVEETVVEETVVEETVVEDKEYIKKVYNALQGELGDKFKKSEEEFNELIINDVDGYASKVYNALKGELGGKFKKSEEEFFKLVLSDELFSERFSSKKKDDTEVSSEASSEESSITSEVDDDEMIPEADSPEPGINIEEEEEEEEFEGWGDLQTSLTEYSLDYSDFSSNFKLPYKGILGGKEKDVKNSSFSIGPGGVLYQQKNSPIISEYNDLISKESPTSEEVDRLEKIRSQYGPNGPSDIFEISDYQKDSPKQLGKFKNKDIYESIVNEIRQGSKSFQEDLETTILNPTSYELTEKDINLLNEIYNLSSNEVVEYNNKVPKGFMWRDNNLSSEIRDSYETKYISNANSYSVFPTQFMEENGEITTLEGEEAYKRALREGNVFQFSNKKGSENFLYGGWRDKFYGLSEEDRETYLYSMQVPPGLARTDVSSTLQVAIDDPTRASGYIEEGKGKGRIVYEIQGELVNPRALSNEQLTNLIANSEYYSSNIEFHGEQGHGYLAPEIELIGTNVETDAIKALRNQALSLWEVKPRINVDVRGKGGGSEIMYHHQNAFTSEVPFSIKVDGVWYTSQGGTFDRDRGWTGTASAGNLLMLGLTALAGTQWEIESEQITKLSTNRIKPRYVYAEGKLLEDIKESEINSITTIEAMLKEIPGQLSPDDMYRPMVELYQDIEHQFNENVFSLTLTGGGQSLNRSKKPGEGGKGVITTDPLVWVKSSSGSGSITIDEIYQRHFIDNDENFMGPILKQIKKNLFSNSNEYSIHYDADNHDETDMNGVYSEEAIDNMIDRFIQIKYDESKSQKVTELKSNTGLLKKTIHWSEVEGVDLVSSFFGVSEEQVNTRMKNVDELTKLYIQQEKNGELSEKEYNRLYELQTTLANDDEFDDLFDLSTREDENWDADKEQLLIKTMEQYIKEASYSIDDVTGQSKEEHNPETTYQRLKTMYIKKFLAFKDAENIANDYLGRFELANMTHTKDKIDDSDAREVADKNLENAKLEFMAVFRLLKLNQHPSSLRGDWSQMGTFLDGLLGGIDETFGMTSSYDETSVYRNILSKANITLTDEEWAAVNPTGEDYIHGTGGFINFIAKLALLRKIPGVKELEGAIGTYASSANRARKITAGTSSQYASESLVTARYAMNKGWAPAGSTGTWLMYTDKAVKTKALMMGMVLEGGLFDLSERLPVLSEGDASGQFQMGASFKWTMHQMSRFSKTYPILNLLTAGTSRTKTGEIIPGRYLKSPRVQKVIDRFVNNPTSFVVAGEIVGIMEAAEHAMFDDYDNMGRFWEEMDNLYGDLDATTQRLLTSYSHGLFMSFGGIYTDMRNNLYCKDATKIRHAIKKLKDKDKEKGAEEPNPLIRELEGYAARVEQHYGNDGTVQKINDLIEANGHITKEELFDIAKARLLIYKGKDAVITEKDVMREMGDLYDMFGMNRKNIKEEGGEDKTTKTEKRKTETRLKSEELLDRLYEHGLIDNNGVKRFKSVTELTSTQREVFEEVMMEMEIMKTESNVLNNFGKGDNFNVQNRNIDLNVEITNRNKYKHEENIKRIDEENKNIEVSKENIDAVIKENNATESKTKKTETKTEEIDYDVEIEKLQKKIKRTKNSKKKKKLTVELNSLISERELNKTRETTSTGDKDLDILLENIQAEQTEGETIIENADKIIDNTINDINKGKEKGEIGRGTDVKEDVKYENILEEVYNSTTSMPVEYLEGLHKKLIDEGYTVEAKGLEKTIENIKNENFNDAASSLSLVRSLAENKLKETKVEETKVEETTEILFDGESQYSRDGGIFDRVEGNKKGDDGSHRTNVSKIKNKSKELEELKSDNPKVNEGELSVSGTFEGSGYTTIVGKGKNNTDTRTEASNKEKMFFSEYTLKNGDVVYSLTNPQHSVKNRAGYYSVNLTYPKGTEVKLNDVKNLLTQKMNDISTTITGVKPGVKPKTKVESKTKVKTKEKVETKVEDLEYTYPKGKKSGKFAGRTFKRIDDGTKSGKIVEVVDGKEVEIKGNDKASISRKFSTQFKEVETQKLDISEKEKQKEEEKFNLESAKELKELIDKGDVNDLSVQSRINDLKFKLGDINKSQYESKRIELNKLKRQQKKEVKEDVTEPTESYTRKKFTSDVEKLTGNKKQSQSITELYDRLWFDHLSKLPENKGKSLDDFYSEQLNNIVKKGEVTNAERITQAYNEGGLPAVVRESASMYENFLTLNQRQKIAEWSGQKEYNEISSEMFKEAFTQYVSEGKSPSKSLEGVFKTFSGITKSTIESNTNVVYENGEIIFTDKKGKVQSSEYGKDVKNIISNLFSPGKEIEITHNVKTSSKGKIVEGSEKGGFRTKSYDVTKDGVTIGKIESTQKNYGSQAKPDWKTIEGGWSYKVNGQEIFKSNKKNDILNQINKRQTNIEKSDFTEGMSQEDIISTVKDKIKNLDKNNVNLMPSINNIKDAKVRDKIKQDYINKIKEVDGEVSKILEGVTEGRPKTVVDGETTSMTIDVEWTDPVSGETKTISLTAHGNNKIITAKALKEAAKIPEHYIDKEFKEALNEGEAPTTTPVIDKIVKKIQDLRATIKGTFKDKAMVLPPGLNLLPGTLDGALLVLEKSFKATGNIAKSIKKSIEYIEKNQTEQENYEFKEDIYRDYAKEILTETQEIQPGTYSENVMNASSIIMTKHASNLKDFTKFIKNRPEFENYTDNQIKDLYTESFRNLNEVQLKDFYKNLKGETGKNIPELRKDMLSLLETTTPAQTKRATEQANEDLNVVKEKVDKIDDSKPKSVEESISEFNDFIDNKVPSLLKGIKTTSKGLKIISAVRDKATLNKAIEYVDRMINDKKFREEQLEIDKVSENIKKLSITTIAGRGKTTQKEMKITDTDLHESMVGRLDEINNHIKLSNDNTKVTLTVDGVKIQSTKGEQYRLKKQVELGEIYEQIKELESQDIVKNKDAILKLYEKADALEYSQLNTKSLSELKHYESYIKDLRNQTIEVSRQERLNRFNRYEKSRSDAIESISGGEELPSRESGERFAGKKKKFYNAPSFNSWFTIMRQMDLNNKTNYFQKEVYTKTHDAQTNMLMDGINFKYKTQEKMAEIFNRKNPTNVSYDISRLSTQKETGIVISKMVEGKMKDLPVTLSQMEMLNLHLQSKSVENKTNLEAMGWTEAKLKELESMLDPEVIELGEYMMSELNNMYDGYNQAHISMYGRPMGRQENYWPSQKSGMENEIVNVYGDRSVTTGRTKSKTENSLELEYASAFNVFQNYVYEMGRWQHMQPTVKELRVIFEDNKVRDNIRHHHGESYLTYIDNFINEFAGNGSNKSNSAFNKILQTMSSNKLAFSPSVGFKQTISSMMFISEMNGWNILKSPVSFTQAMTGTGKLPIDITTSSVWINRKERRVFHGMPQISPNTGVYGEQSLFNYYTSGTKVDYFGKWYDYSIRPGLAKGKDIFGKAGDKFGIGFFGQQYALQQYNKYKGEGKTHQESHDLAMRDFEIHARNTQQNDLWMEASHFHRNSGAMGKIFSMFTTSMDAVRQRSMMDTKELINGKDMIKNSKRLFTQQGIMQGMFYIANSGFYFPDEDADLANTTMYITNNFTQGMPIVTQFGDVLEYFIQNDKLKPSDVFSSELVRFVSTFKDAERLEKQREDLVIKLNTGDYNVNDMVKLQEIDEELSNFGWDLLNSTTSFTLPAGNFKNVVRIKDGLVGMFMQDEKNKSLQREIDELGFKYENGEPINAEELVGKNYWQLLTGLTSPYYEGRNFEDWWKGNAINLGFDVSTEGVSTKKEREVKSLIKDNLEDRIELKNITADFLKEYDLGDGSIEGVEKAFKGLKDGDLEKFKTKLKEADDKFRKENDVVYDEENNKILINGEEVKLDKVYEQLPSLKWTLLRVRNGKNREKFQKIIMKDYKQEFELDDEMIERFILINYFKDTKTKRK